VIVLLVVRVYVMWIEQICGLK